MSRAKEGDKVKVHYSGMLEDGKQFDSSEGEEPFEFTIGQNTAIPGFENGVIGMKVGEKKKISIPAKEAYGEHKDHLVATVKRSEISSDINPEVGMMLQIPPEEGKPPTNVSITELNEETLTLDGNHPLAGKELTFELNLVSIG